jgi:hypothetical protein
MCKNIATSTFFWSKLEWGTIKYKRGKSEGLKLHNWETWGAKSAFKP